MVVCVLQVILACEVMDIIHYMEMERVGKRLWTLLLIRAGDLYLELHPETSFLLLGPQLPTSDMSLHCCVINTESFQCFMFLIPFEVSFCEDSQGVLSWM